MPFKPVEQVKCPKCGKSVYAAEARKVGELEFHKECYKCSMCNKMLDSTNVNCHETVLFCKTCHGRKYGPKGYGFGGGAGGLSMDTGAHLDYGRDDTIKLYKPPQAAPGEGCPRCGGKVFAAEEMHAKDRVYHKSCFNCKSCKKPLDSMLHCDGPDSEVYCKACYTNKFGLKGYGFGGGQGALQSCKPQESSPMVRSHGNTDVIIKPEEGEDGCPRCGGKVFSAEMMLAKDKPYHKRCFKCKVCKRPLDSMNHCDGPDAEVYCKLCYAKKYGPKGYGFAAGSGGVLTAENIPGGEEGPTINPASAQLDVAKIRAAEGEGCPRCGGKVFMAEEMFARGRSWHKKCFSCCHCRRPLDSMVGCDAPDGEIYCKLCYAKRFGPKGYGFSGGAGGVMSADNLGADAEDQVRKQQVAFTALDVAKIRAPEGEGCPRCGGKVFMAEEVNARGRQWHRSCYSCRYCKRPLDSVSGCDAPDGEVYCKLCYAKKYGPKGYGFCAGAGGVLTAENIPGGAHDPEINPASVSIDTAAIQAAPGEGCPRCGGKVFVAEEMLSRGNKWHKRCFNCCDCNRPLDAMVLCDGPDSEIYCKLCYAKKFGPKGYGFASGAGGVLFPESIDMDGENQPQVIGAAPSFPTKHSMKNIAPAREGQSRCPRCGGAVFQAESMVARGQEWHKTCFNCVECKRPLDSMIGCDAPDGEIYCKLCYAKRHGPKGYGYGHTATLISLGTDDGSPIPPDIRQFGFGLERAKQFLEETRSISTEQHGDTIRTVEKTVMRSNVPGGRVPRGVDEHGELNDEHNYDEDLNAIEPPPIVPVDNHEDGTQRVTVPQLPVPYPDFKPRTEFHPVSNEMLTKEHSLTNEMSAEQQQLAGMGISSANFVDQQHSESMSSSQRMESMSASKQMESVSTTQQLASMSASHQMESMSSSHQMESMSSSHQMESLTASQQMELEALSQQIEIMNQQQMEQVQTERRVEYQESQESEFSSKMIASNTMSETQLQIESGEGMTGQIAHDNSVFTDQ